MRLLNGNKKYIISLFVTVIGFLGLISGTSYAILKGSTSSTNEQIIKAGSVELLLTEDFESLDKPITVMSDANGLLQEEIYDFNIRNIGSVAAQYDLMLETVENSSITAKYIKVGLEVNGKEIGPMKLSSVKDYIIDNNTLNKNEVVRYKMRLWIDASEENNFTSDSLVNLKLNVEAKQSESATTIDSTGAALELIKNKGKNGLEEIKHSLDKNLQIGSNSSLTEYRYQGSNNVVTNNYVYFNCTDITKQTKETCELYRIIGVFPVDNGTGTIENRIKLVKNTPYEINTQQTISDTNDWSKSYIKDVLNDTYYNTISTKYQELIGNAKYYLGGYSNSEVKKDAMYAYERQTTGSEYYYENNAISWIGKIGNIYASDLGYSASNSCDSNLNQYNDNCKNSYWLNMENISTITQLSTTSDSIFYSSTKGLVSEQISNLKTSYPTFYLNKDVEFYAGDGTSANPYQMLK